MSVTEASRKVNISPKSGGYYYNVYNNDPEKRIPLPRDRNARTYTQEQIGNLIRYINSDKMTLKEASAKAKMDYDSARRYYKRYLEDPNHNIPVSISRQHYTQDQKNEFIGYIINDKMTIKAASKKANIPYDSGYNYCQKYLNNQKRNGPTRRPRVVSASKNE
jgi:molybdenum-dependent DNA-binding transcriptional regulator ModE